MSEEIKALVDSFTKRYKDTAVWQLDTIFQKFARLIELEIMSKGYQNGEQLRNIIIEIADIKNTIFGPPDQKTFWNWFIDAQAQYPEFQGWETMRSYVQHLEKAALPKEFWDKVK